jgi:hypothetical protein
MKAQEVTLLLVAGLLVWIVGTIYYGYRGPTILETTSLRYWTAFALSPVLSGILCIAILRWRQVPAASWTSAMLLLAIPGMVGEAVVLTHLSVFMPKLQNYMLARVQDTEHYYLLPMPLYLVWPRWSRLRHGSHVGDKSRPFLERVDCQAWVRSQP